MQYSRSHSEISTASSLYLHFALTFSPSGPNSVPVHCQSNFPFTCTVLSPGPVSECLLLPQCFLFVIVTSLLIPMLWYWEDADRGTGGLFLLCPQPFPLFLDSNQIFLCSPLNSTHFPSLILVLTPWCSFCHLFLSCCWECTKSSQGQWTSSFFDTLHPWPTGSERGPVGLWPGLLWNSVTGNCRGLTTSVRIWLLKAAVHLTCEQSALFNPRVNIFTWCGTIWQGWQTALFPGRWLLAG